MATLPQIKKRLQTDITQDAHARIRVEAARQGKRPGDIVSELAVKHLPAVSAGEQTAKSDAA